MESFIASGDIGFVERRQPLILTNSPCIGIKHHQHRRHHYLGNCRHHLQSSSEISSSSLSPPAVIIAIIITMPFHGCGGKLIKSGGVSFPVQRLQFAFVQTLCNFGQFHPFLAAAGIRRHANNTERNAQLTQIYQKKGNPSQKKKVCIQKKGSLKNFPYSDSWIIYFVYS